MARPKIGTIDEENKYQQQQAQLEIELGKLRREYTILDRDRELSIFYNAQGGKLLKVLQISAMEHTNILADLSRAKSAFRDREDRKHSEELNDLLAVYDYYDHNVLEAKSHMKEICNQIKVAKKNVILLRSKQVTDRQHEERVWKAVKTLEGLENRLELQMIKFGTICTANKHLREEIDNLLAVRATFLEDWTGLVAKLQKGKHIMLDLIEQATIAYDQREDWCNKLQALRMKAHHDYLGHMNEMREHSRRYDNHLKLEHFFDVKGRKRVMRDLQEKVAAQREQHQRQLAAKCEQYQAMLDEIKEFARCSNLEPLAKKFHNTEAENFMCFRYVNDLIAEMESMGDELGKLHLEIEHQRALHEIRATSQASRLEELEQTILSATEVANAADNSLKKWEKHHTAMLQGTDHIFRLMRCHNDPLVKLLGENETVKWYNVLLYLEIIEGRLLQMLLQIYDKEKERKSGEPRQRSKAIDEAYQYPLIFPIDAIVQSNPCALCVVHEMVSEVVETVQKVYDREKVKRHLERRLALPDGLARVHNLSKCHLPAARSMMQKRYE